MLSVRAYGSSYPLAEGIVWCENGVFRPERGSMEALSEAGICTGRLACPGATEKESRLASPPKESSSGDAAPLYRTGSLGGFSGTGSRFCLWLCLEDFLPPFSSPDLLRRSNIPKLERRGWLIGSNVASNVYLGGAFCGQETARNGSRQICNAIRRTLPSFGGRPTHRVSPLGGACRACKFRI